jgi:predicted transcriptional regulator of viral defense system
MYDLVSVTDRQVLPEDSRVLREAALRGSVYVHWPNDRPWLEQIEGIGDPLRRLQGMKKRGSLAPIARGRWIVMPPGASTVSQAAPPPILLAALLDGRAEWYLGFLSALIDHGLTDIDSETLYVAVRGRSIPSTLTAGGRTVRVVRLVRADDWAGVERLRAQGRIFTYRSDIERTLLDTLDHPKMCGPAEVWVRAWGRAASEERLDVGRLFDYVEQRNAAVQARCAYWLRELGQTRSARRIMHALGGRMTGARPLDASRSFGEGPWPRDRETGLVLNMPQETIDGWLEYGK